MKRAKQRRNANLHQLNRCHFGGHFKCTTTTTSPNKQIDEFPIYNVFIADYGYILIRFYVNIQNHTHAFYACCSQSLTEFSRTHTHTHFGREHLTTSCDESFAPHQNESRNNSYPKTVL